MNNISVIVKNFYVFLILSFLAGVSIGVIYGHKGGYKEGIKACSRVNLIAEYKKEIHKLSEDFKIETIKTLKEKRRAQK